MESLYQLTLNKIALSSDIKYYFNIPKCFYYDIGFSMKIYNKSYFAQICNNFNLFCELLLSDCLSDLYLITFLRENPHISKKLTETFLQISDESQKNLKVGNQLGIFLKLSGFLIESEKILIFVSSWCKNKNVGLLFLNILKELMHVQTLLDRDIKVNETYEILQKEILKMQNTGIFLNSIYVGCANFELSRHRFFAAYLWWCRSYKDVYNFSTREKIDMYLVMAKTCKNISYLEKAAECYSELKQSQYSLYKLYHAKILRQFILSIREFLFHDDFLYWWHLYTENYFFSGFHHDINGKLRDICLNVIGIYKNIFGKKHFLTIKVKSEMNTFITKKFFEYDLFYRGYQDINYQKFL